MIKVTKKYFHPEMSAYSKISPLPPSHLLDLQESDEDDVEDDGIYCVAHSPLELHVKCQDLDEDYEDQQYYQPYLAPSLHYQHYEYQEHCPREMAHLPPALIQDLQAMLADYRQRFPSQDVPKEPLAQAQALEKPSSPATSIVPQTFAQEPDPVDLYSSNEEREEGEIPDPTADPWEDYTIPTPCPPSHHNGEGF